MGNLYDTDIVAWAWEQAALLRRGQLSAIDTLNIAEEIEDVAKNEQRQLGSRLVVLLSHLLRWKYQPSHRGHSWLQTIATQRKAIARALRRTPSLKRFLEDEEWLEEVWDDAVTAAMNETQLHLPSRNPWTLSQVLDPDFFPD